MAASFDDWLRGMQQTRDDGDANLVWSLIKAGGLTPAKGGDLGDYVAALQAAAKTAAQPADDATAALIRLHMRWTRTNAEKPSAGQITYGAIGLLAFGAVIAISLYRGIFNPQFLSMLENHDTTRALVTFIFTIATVSIVLLVAIAIFWRSDDLGGRFSQAKDLLTILVGILGTIIGFYFGSGQNGAGAAVMIDALALSERVVDAGTATRLTAALTGGRAPYVYTVTLTDPMQRLPAETLAAISDGREKTSTDGRIGLSLQMPGSVPEPGSVVIVTLTARDAGGNEATRDAILTIRPAGPAGPAAPP